MLLVFNSLAVQIANQQWVGSNMSCMMSRAATSTILDLCEIRLQNLGMLKPLLAGCSAVRIPAYKGKSSCNFACSWER